MSCCGCGGECPCRRHTGILTRDGTSVCVECYSPKVQEKEVLCPILATLVKSEISSKEKDLARKTTEMYVSDVWWREGHDSISTNTTNFRKAPLWCLN